MKSKRWPRALYVLLFLASCSLQAHAQSGVSPTVLSLPSGPGSLGGIGENVQANLNMGLMSYQIKVLVPKGRGAATPNPSITYSSSAGSSMLGIGWSFTAGAHIERGTVRGLPTYTNKDVFFAGGELVKLPKGPFYRARMEGGFVRYLWKQTDSSDQSGYWIAQYPDGSKGYFGANSKGQLRPNSQISGTQGTFRWELVTKVDRNGNRIEYSYFKDGSKAYPDQISWVFGKDGSPLYQLRFTYEDRKDHISDGKPGFDVQTKKRLKELQITSAGQRFRSYSFQYEDATGLSRLIKVTRYGRDPNKAYPIQFSMKYSEATVDADAVKLVTMPTSLGLNMGTGDADFVDINGDGLPDLVDTSKPKHIFHINQLKLDGDMKQSGHDFPKALSVQNAKNTSAKLSNPTVQLMDYNGDGTTDLVDAVNMKIYLNKGNGKWEDHSETLKSYPISTNNPNIRFFDYDGDKKIDMLFSDGTITYYWLNDGQGNWKKQAGATDIGASFSKDKLRLIDINGDGLMDVVWITKDSLRYRKYLGYGKWSGWIKVQVDLSSVKNFPLSDNAQFSDMNGDGMADMVMLSGSKIYYMVNRNGNTFADPIELNTGNLDIPDASKTTIRIVDINGNGSRDIVWIDSSGKVSYLEIFTQRPNLLETISNGIGQRINVAYGSSVYFKLRDDTCKVGVDKACAGPWKNKLPMAFTVVTQITTWASRSSAPLDQAGPSADERPQIQSIYYHHGFYDGKEKKFRGYRHVETLYDGDSSVQARKDELKYDVGDKDPYMHGRLLSRSISNGGAHIYRQVATTWADCPVSLGVDGKSLTPQIRFICPKAKETLHIEGQDKATWRTTRQEMSYDGFGNVVLHADLGEKDKAGDEKYTQTRFLTPTDPNAIDRAWILSAPRQLLRCDAPPQGNENCAEIRYFYDGEPFKGLPLGQLQRGDLIRVQMRVKAGQDLWRTPMARKYDEYGNIVAYRDLSGQLRTITWDPQYSRFPVKEELQLSGYSLIATTQYNFAYSKVIKSTNFNGQSVTYTYDSFGRLTSLSNPTDAPGKPSVRYTYELQAPLSRIVTETRSRSGGAFDRKSILCFDGLGRKRSQRQKIRDDRYLVTSLTTYNRLHMRAKVWDIHQGKEACTWAAPQGVNAVLSFYDGTGRLIRRVKQDGGVERWVFEPFLMHFFDPADNDKDSPFYDTPTSSYMDGLGRVIREVNRPKKGETIATAFAYTSVNVSHKDMIHTVTFADGSTKLQSYDLLANTLRVMDPDRQEIRFVYNDANQIIERIDARGKAMVFTYDAMGRPKTQGEKGRPETLVTYTYDQAQKELPTATYLKGRLSKVSYPGGLYLFSYDRLGHPILERHVLMGVAFDIKREYDNSGMQTAKVFPDGRRIEYVKDSLGRLLSVPGVLKQIEYNADGTTRAWVAQSGLSHSFTYNKRFWPTSIAAGQLLKLSYDYDKVGNPRTITQQLAGATSTNQYDYDAMYRLLQASLSDGQEILNYRQDALGNLTSKTSSLGAKSPVHMPAYQYSQSKIHQLSQVGGLKLQYDAAGHMTKRGELKISWDYLGRCTQATGPGVQVRSWYGNQMVRLIREEQGVHTFYISDLFEIRDGVGIAYIKLGRNRVASIRSPAISARFFDDLAPTKGGDLSPAPDGKISAADAWLYHATRKGILSAKLRKRPIDLDMTRDMLRASLSRLLDGDKEQLHFYHADHLGSIRAVTDGKGAVVTQVDYYPYGKLRSHRGAPLAYGYMNAEYDGATGTHHFMKRSFDPKLGRWLSPDPAFAEAHAIDAEFNSYGMVQNNPLRMREIQGTFSIFGLEIDPAQAKDLTILGFASLGTAMGLLKLGQMRRSQSFKKMNSEKKHAFVRQGAMNMSWALWAGAAAASRFTHNEDLVKGLNIGMFAFWAASEAVATRAMYKQHKKETSNGLKGRKGLVRARMAVTGLVAASGVLSAMGGKVGEVSGYASSALFILSGLATPAGARVLGKVFSFKRLFDVRGRAKGIHAFVGNKPRKRRKARRRKK